MVFRVPTPLVCDFVAPEEQSPKCKCGKTRSVVEVGQVISGKYKLLRLLGDGGMGSVYEAEHLTLGTHVAIKVLHGDLARRSGLIERFLQEARVSAQIRSPHVCNVSDVDRTPDGVAYLVMELLQGEPLSNVIKRERKLAVPTTCEYTSQILQALEAAHALGVIHRDLKPDNVFLTFTGGKSVLKLIDFGIAKLKREGNQAGTKNLTVAGMLMGTPEYMAPEQAYSADKVDVRADLYAVGVMMYEMLSGTAPVSGDDPRVMVLKVERGEITPLVHAAPGIQPEIAGFVHRAMAPRPEVRFANATEMRIALEAIQSGKRQNTAQLAGSVSPQPPPNASVAPVAGGAAAGAAALAETHQPRGDIGTGTVMGAPVDAALAPNAMGSGPRPALGGGTQRAAPVDPAALHAAQAQQQMPPPMMMAPNPYGPTTPPAQAQGRRGGGGSGLVIGLAVVALLLGAGAVVAYVMSQPGSTSTNPPPPTFTTTTVTTPTILPPNTVTTPATTVAPPLTNTPTTLTTTSTVTPPPKRDAGGGGQAHADGGAPGQDSGGGGGTGVIVTPFGTFPYPGPRPLLYPADQPWPPPWVPPAPAP